MSTNAHILIWGLLMNFSQLIDICCNSIYVNRCVYNWSYSFISRFEEDNDLIVINKGRQQICSQHRPIHISINVNRPICIELFSYQYIDKYINIS